MNRAVEEWVEKAEEDFRVALALRRSRRYLSCNAICFHAQQCVEKYLKAVLEDQHVVIRKIHSLTALMDYCGKAGSILAEMRPDMVRLSAYAIEFRYPGESATAEEAKEAVNIMKKARKLLRQALGLSKI